MQIEYSPASACAPKRKMWVYPSEEIFLKHNSYALQHNQMAEKAIASIELTKEQYRLMCPAWKRIFTTGFWTSPIYDTFPSPLYHSIPGSKLGDYEAAVADLKKKKKENDKYVIPVRILASV